MTNDFLQRISKLPRERLALLAAELKDRLERAEESALSGRGPIAIVGLGCRIPGGADSPARFWELLAGGVDAVGEVPRERWDPEILHDPDPEAPGKIATTRGAFLSGLEDFDARFFGIAPREAVSLDPQHRLVLEVAWEALEDAGLAADRLGGSAGGVFLGVCGHEYLELMLERPLESVDSYFASGGAGSMAAGRLAYLLGLHGPALSVDTACSSSLVALHLACESLRNRECDLAIAGGVNALLGVETMVALTKSQMLSPSGRCRTFDEGADGMVRGEGCGVLVLKRLADALADGDRVHAVIRGTAINQDGRSSGITAPNGTAQVAVMRTALARAGLTGSDVDYVEAHGTGTRLGDPIEVRALGAVYGDRPADGPLRIGSVKTNVGHLEAAAGVTGVLKAVLALKQRTIPPHLHLTRRNPLIEWDRWPIEVPTERTAWDPRTGDGVRRAAVSSFGFSGTNAHVILEEAPAAAAPAAGDDGRAQLLTVSAKTETALRELAALHAEALEAEPAAHTFAEYCHTAATGRARMAHRVAVVGGSGPAAAAALRDWLEDGRESAAVAAGRAGALPEPVFLFTGQGAQYTGMGRGLYEGERVFRDALDRCDAALRDELEVPLLEVLYPADGKPADGALVDRTAYTQPALFAIEYALAELWRSWGIEPGAVAGHSVGEYVGAVVAGVLDLEDALRLVAARGRLMQQVPAGGAMAAVLAEAAVVEEVLAECGGAEVAAYNAPLNTVITGPEPEVAAALEACNGRGIETRRLVVSHAFHSRLLDPVLGELEQRAAAVSFSAPDVPFFSTLTGAPADAAALARPGYWRDQARRPVRFMQTLQALHAAGHQMFLELGPHPVLSGMGRATFGNAGPVFLGSLRRGEEDRSQLLRSLAALHVRGAEPAWSELAGRRHLRLADLPTYPFERSRYWLGWSLRGHGVGAAAPGVVAPDVGATAEAQASLLWDREWVDAGGEDAFAGAPWDPAAVRDHIVERIPELMVAHGGDVYDEVLPRLDALCAAYARRALEELGEELVPGATVPADLRERVGVPDRHSRLFSRMLKILVEDGVLEPLPDGAWRVGAGAAGAPEDPDATQAALLAAYPTCAAELELTGRCASRLADVLRGQQDPMELLFPGGSLEATEAVYGESPSNRIFTTLVGDAVEAAVAQRVAGRRVRVLEVGAGTGATTGRVLPCLSAEDTEYVFTDISPYFLERARERFAGYPFLEYRLLDVASDPVGQGFAPAAFDLIVASNVLHATPDLRGSLAHLRTLLAPGGMLVLLEAVRPQRFGDLTVGLMDGWWSFADAEVRPDYALVSTDRWFSLLRKTGYEAATAAPALEHGDPRAAGMLGQQAVIVARAAAVEPVAAAGGGQARWLALARADAPSGRLAESLRAAGLDVRLLEPPGGDVADAVEEAWDQALDAALAAEAPAGIGLLHLLAVDESAAEDDDGPAALARQRRSTWAAVRAAQAAVRAESGAPLAIVTVAAQPAAADDAVDPTGAPLWGLGRALAAEVPELPFRCIDLPADWPDAVPALAGVLRGAVPAAEDELAVRAGRTLAPRIVPWAEPSGGVAPRFDATASYIVTGGLAGLGLRVAEWLGERGAGTLVLLGRGAPSDDAQAVLQRIRAAGTAVEVLRGDVGDPASVEALVDAAGADRLRGVFHCAGVTDDATLLHLEWGMFERVMRAKVEGSWNLHRATRELELDHFVLFSSAAAFLGSAAQANHAAANAYLGGLAAYRRAQGLPALTIDWGAWSEIGAATRGDVIRRAGAVGIGLIDPETGLDLLERLLRHGETQVAAVAIDWAAFLGRHASLAPRGIFSRLWRAPGDAAAEPAGAAAGGQPAADDLMQAVVAASPGSRRTVLFDGLHREAARALGLEGGETIDPGTPLTELGLDSLMAVELRNALGLRLGLTFPATLLFNYPTLAELTDHLLAELDGDQPAVPAGAASADVPALDDMDEAQMAELLARKLSTSGSTDE